MDLCQSMVNAADRTSPIPMVIFALAAGFIAVIAVSHWVLRRLMQRPENWPGQWRWGLPED